jgi:protein-S-isoprenylcysteine O-methyltransferase Ste14
MPVIALALTLDLVFVLVAFGLRTWVQWHRSRDGGWRLGRPHSTAELAARLLLLGSGVALAVAAVSDPDRESGTRVVIGAGIAVAAIVLTTTAQMHMGDSWRIGLDPDERTDLVTNGLYRFVRNPIYTGMVAFAVGQAVLLGGGLAWAAALAMAVGAQVQVRAVEEPYLVVVHGDGFRRWAATAGRFVPVIGRASTPPTPARRPA